MFQSGLFDNKSDTVAFIKPHQASFERYFSGKSLLKDGRMVTAIGANEKACSRETRVGDMVDCYRNLNKPALFSIKQRYGAFKGRVSGYARSIVLKNPVFAISETSRQRVLKEKSRNVHSYVRGEFIHSQDGDVILDQLGGFLRVSYSPYVSGNFFSLERDELGNIIQQSIQPFFDVAKFQYAIINGRDVFLCNL